jgi:pyruvate dehydrogenase E2 component (dihydrolipoamide acetyltransferase)
MVRSAYTAPHVTEWVSVDVTDLLALMDRVRHAPQAEGHRLTPLVFVARSLLRAAGLHPEVNATWDGERGDIVQFADVNLGIAVATPRGLLVPNIRAAQHLEFFDLADALSRLVSRARAGEADLQELSNGTITITNIGVFGVDGGTPILNPGEAAILCMGQVREQPWVVDGVIVVRSIMLLTLSFDHRLIDGALGSQFLGAIAHGLEHPELLLPDVR